MEPSRTITASDDDAPDWPLHQRLSGVVARTLAVGLALLPAVALLAARADHGAVVLGLILVFAFPLLAVERRDASLAGALLRHLVGAVVGVGLVPVAVTSAQHAGDPMGAYGQLGSLLDRGVLLGLLFWAPFASLPLALLFAVRARTSRVLPQVLAGVLTPALLLTTWVTGTWSGTPRVFGAILLSGALVPTALVVAERLVSRRDPRAPRPIERDPRACFAGFGLLLLLLGTLPTLLSWAARWTYLEQSLEESGPTLVEGVAGTLRSLGSAGARNAPAGLTNGYLVRVVVAPGGRRWCVAADPVDPRLAQYGSWVGDHTGAVLSYAAPVAIDPQACAAPPGGTPR